MNESYGTYQRIEQGRERLSWLIVAFVLAFLIIAVRLVLLMVSFGSDDHYSNLKNPEILILEPEEKPKSHSDITIMVGAGGNSSGEGDVKIEPLSHNSAISSVADGRGQIDLMVGGNPDEQQSDSDGVNNVSNNISSLDIKFSRANIVDRNGELLAGTIKIPSLYANPSEVMEPEILAQKLHKIFPEKNYQTLLRRLSSKRKFVWIERHIHPRKQNMINSLGEPGLYFRQEERRAYPHGNLVSHILGYTGIDNYGLAGLEKEMDKRITEFGEQGKDLQLSLDIRVQSLLYDELKAGKERFEALGAVGIVLDVTSNEVIAMVSLPDFDPHQPAAANSANLFNRATLGSYEMGSIFKPFTVAMAIESGKVMLSDSYDASKPIKYGSFVIKDFHGKGRWLSVPEIFVYSSNIGSVKMLQDVGREYQRDFLADLGLLDPLTIELSERSMPIIPVPWREINAMTIAFGHGIAVTPLHMAQGIGALVNGGTWRPVTLLKGGNRNAEKMGIARRVVSEDTSRIMSKLLRLAVIYGTGKQGDVYGFDVGGKTGSAEKVSGQGGYSTDAMLSSYVAVFPMVNPKYLVLVILDEPKGNEDTYGFATGGWTAAPITAKVISRMSAVLGLTPLSDNFQSLREVRRELRDDRARSHIRNEMIDSGIGDEIEF